MAWLAFAPVTTGAAADGIFKKSNINPYAFRSSLSVYQANEPMGTWLGDKGYVGGGG